MKHLNKKILSLAVAFFLCVQFSIVGWQKTYAGTLDTVKTVLGMIEVAVGPNWPLPITSGQIFAMIHIIEICDGTSDEQLMACVKAANEDPDIGPMLKSSTGIDDLELGFKIYIDIKNSDYVQLLIDGKEPIGCAAAQIFTGVNICALMEELIAVAEAVGDAAAYAFSWLDDLDVALFGQTAHMDADQYYVNRWRPYVRSYVEQSQQGEVSEGAQLQPYMTPQASQLCGNSFAFCGLDVLSLSQIYDRCVTYYEGFKDGSGGSNCASNKTAFLGRANLLVQQAKAMDALGEAAQKTIDGQSKIWNGKIDILKSDMAIKYPTLASQIDADPFIQSKFKAYSMAIGNELGKITGDSHCLDAVIGFECVYFQRGSGIKYKSLAYNIFAKMVASDYKNAEDALTSPVAEIQPNLLGFYNGLRDAVDQYLAGKISSANYQKKSDIVGPAWQQLMALKATCKTLTQSFVEEKYADLCANSEPLTSCFVKVDELSKAQINAESDVATDEFLAKVKPGIDSCITGAKKVVSEWQHMDNLHDPYVDGWFQFYQDHFDGNYNNKNKGAKVGSLSKDLMGWELDLAFDACVSEHMKKFTQETVAPYASIISQFTAKPPTNLVFPGAKKTQKSSGKVRSKPGSKPYQLATPVIAEGFCKDDAVIIADPSRKATDPAQAFVPDTTPAAANDPSKRDANEVAKAQSLAANSGCKPHEWTDTKGLQKDTFHLVCTDKDSYSKCVKALGGDVRASYAWCTVPKGNSVASSYVDKLCCEKQFMTELEKLQTKPIGEEMQKVPSTSGGVPAVSGLGGVAVAISYKVTPIAGVGGSVSPMGMQSVKKGETISFHVKANAGLKVKSVGGCGGTLKEETYTTGPINSDCTVMANFESAQTAPTLQGRPAVGGSGGIKGIQPGGVISPPAGVINGGQVPSTQPPATIPPVTVPQGIPVKRLSPGIKK